MNRFPRALHRYATITAIATFLLLLAGGMVTSTDSGLAVPDWPMSYGTWFPPMVGGILYEHGHRMIAGVVGLMIFILGGWLWKVEPRRWVRRVGYVACGAVIAQALLGGLTVLWLLPPAVSIAHACLGPTVFCLIVALARCTSPRWQDRPERLNEQRWLATRRLGIAAAGLAILQLMLGAIIRHTGFAVMPHIAGALALLLMSGWTASRARSFPSSLAVARTDAWRLLGLLCVQVALGIAVFTHRGAVILRTAHQTTGALILAQAVLLAWELRRRHQVGSPPQLQTSFLTSPAVGRSLGDPSQGRPSRERPTAPIET